MSPAKMTSKSPDLQNDFQAPQTVSIPFATSSSLRHFVSTPRILNSACCFIFCSRFMAYPTKNENMSLYSRLCNNLKNRLIDKLKIFIHSVDPKFFFVKSLHKASVRKRRPSTRL